MGTPRHRDTGYCLDLLLRLHLMTASVTLGLALGFGFVDWCTSSRRFVACCSACRVWLMAKHHDITKRGGYLVALILQLHLLLLLFPGDFSFLYLLIILFFLLSTRFWPSSPKS